MQITAATKVALFDQDEPYTAIWTGSLGDFFAENSDGIGDDERAEIQANLAANGHTRTGGGAHGDFVIYVEG